MVIWSDCWIAFDLAVNDPCSTICGCLHTASGPEHPCIHRCAGFAEFSVKQLMQLNILDKLEDLQNVSGMASKEYSLEKLLDKMRKDWDGVCFKCVTDGQDRESIADRWLRVG